MTAIPPCLHKINALGHCERCGARPNDGVASSANRTSYATKLSILEQVCGAQASEETKAGNAGDASEWIEIRKSIGELK